MEEVGNDLLQVLVAVSMPQNVGGQTDAVSADKRGIITPIVHCYLAHPKAYVVVIGYMS